MRGWTESDSRGRGHPNLALFCLAAASSFLLFWVFYPQIEAVNRESPVLVNIMFAPAMAIGFLYGIRITERAVNPEETRSAFRRKVVKTFLFLFVMGGMFSSVNFALNGGSVMPETVSFDDGLVSWVGAFVTANGGATFLIISSIALMAAATKRMVGMNTGFLNRMVTFVGTFAFFTMLFLSFTDSDPTSSGVFLYTFYQAGIVGGAFYAMNRITKNRNMIEDFANGF